LPPETFPDIKISQNAFAAVASGLRHGPRSQSPDPLAGLGEGEEKGKEGKGRKVRGVGIPKLKVWLALTGSVCAD